jgi:hypothetical protein
MNTCQRRPESSRIHGAHLNGIEKLGDDSGYASEEGRSAGTFHLMTVALDFHECAPLGGDILTYPRRIHITNAWQKHCRGRPGIARNDNLLARELLEIPG